MNCHFVPDSEAGSAYALARAYSFGLALLVMLGSSRYAAALPPYPSCSSNLMVPAVASSQGQVGTAFRSDVWLLNMSPGESRFLVAYRCSTGCDNRVPHVAEVFVPPGTIGLFKNVVVSLFNAPESAGALLFSQCGFGNFTVNPPMVISRTYTAAPSGSGTMGTEVPSFTTDRLTRFALFVGLAGNGGALDRGYRTNCGIVPFFGVSAIVRLSLRASSGATLATGDIAATDPVQLNDVFGALGAPTVVTEDASLTVESDVPVLPYCIVIDNLSGDGVFLPFSTERPPAR